MKNSESNLTLFPETTQPTTPPLPPIDLAVIAQKLLNNADITDKAKSQKVVICADKLAKKLPELTPLGKMPLVSIGMRNGVPFTLMPCLYRESDTAVIILPDLNATVEERLTLVSFRTGKHGYAVVKFDDGLTLKIAIAQSEDHLSELEENDRLYDGIQGTLEQLDISFLKERPIIEIPLKNLPIKTAFTVIGTGKTSRQFNTPLIDITDKLGNRYLNVICNSFLVRWSPELNKSFEIKAIIEEKRKTKKGIEITYKAIINPLDGVDLSNI